MNIAGAARIVPSRIINAPHLLDAQVLQPQAIDRSHACRGTCPDVHPFSLLAALIRNWRRMASRHIKILTVRSANLVKRWAGEDWTSVTRPMVGMKDKAIVGRVT